MLHTNRWNTERKNYAKDRHLHTVAQVCRATYSQLTHASLIINAMLSDVNPLYLTWPVSAVEKNPVKWQYLLHMSSQYGELRPTNGWDLLASLGQPSKFQRVTRLGSVTARYSNSTRKPNFAALNRRRHLYLAGRPPRWAMAHILFFLLHVRVIGLGLGLGLGLMLGLVLGLGLGFVLHDKAPVQLWDFTPC